MTIKFRIEKEHVAGTKDGFLVELNGGCDAVWMQSVEIVEPRHRQDKRKLRPRKGNSMRATTKGN